MVRLLFICSGNICRSPTAEGVMRSLLADDPLQDQVEIDSAAIGPWHVGQRADPRARAAAAARGIRLDSISRQIAEADLDHFDLILAADHDNIADLRSLAGDDPDRSAKIRLLREYDPDAVAAGELDVPDPYYGGQQGFHDMLDLVDAACRGLRATLALDTNR